MVFSSLTFLFAYLPIVLLVYFMAPVKWRNFVLLAVSLFFYGWGEPVYVVVMVFSILVNWGFGLGIEKASARKPASAKRLLIICIVFNLALLGFFKYTDFIIHIINSTGIAALKPMHIRLPIGISFYTFQTMSYPIDLYQKKTKVQRNPVDFGAYVCMFPQLIAGPIVRYTDIAKELRERVHSTEEFSAGISRFLCGLSKKVLLANNIGAVYESIAALSPADQSTLTAWIGILCFAFQIYFDFSGYSDMAIGLGRMFGFHFLENFNYPYIATSVTDFWRRWHMSLSYWFRDYVYIPLGGNRCGTGRQVMNILFVWFLTGLWHGASWNFVLWGMFYGIVLLIEKLFLYRYLKVLPVVFRHCYTMLVVLLAWVFFAFTDLSAGLRYFGYLFQSTGVLFNGLTVFYLRNHITLLIACILASVPQTAAFFRTVLAKRPLIVPVLSVLSFLLCVFFIVDASYNPFLYFRF